MEKISDILVSPIQGRKYNIDENGTKPGVLFNDAGIQTAIFMKRMIDEFDVMTFLFAEGSINDDGEIVVHTERKVYANGKSWANTSTGVIVGRSEAFDETGALKEGYVSEYEWYVQLFGMSVNASSSIYQKVQAFISDKLSDGVLNYQPVN